MRSTFSGLEIARTALQISQKGLDVTGHNVANVDTVGYTRQRLVNAAYEPHAAAMAFRPSDNALVGSGAHVKILDQIRSSFLDRQFRSEQSVLSYWSTRTQGLTYVESLFEGDENADLGAGIKGLFDAFNALTKEGNDKEQRTLLKDKGAILCENFNILFDRLLEQQANQNLSVKTKTDQINLKCDAIALLNRSIISFELSGQPANDLRDRRNLLLDELSAIIDISYEEQNNGEFILSTGGRELVNHVTVNRLVCVDGANAVAGGEDVAVVCWEADGALLALSNGELKASVDLRDSADADRPGVPFFISQLNNLARAIVSQVNAVHEAGVTHQNTGALTGISFFEVPAGGLEAVTAGNMKLDAKILESVYNIAASLSNEALQDGNQENARLLFELYNRQGIKLFEGTPDEVAIGSFNSYLSGVVLDVAVTLGHSKNMQLTQSVRVRDADNQRTSISGVSLDEEMTNLLKYQHAYSGASRVITAMDEVLDILINRMGLVGRS